MYAAKDGASAIRIFESRNIDLILLDLMLPDVPGTDVCKHIRQTSDVRIIMVTVKGDMVDRVVGLELGADDYIPKPYSYRELLACVKAVLRRSSGAASEEETLECGDIVMDVSRHVVTIRGREATMPLREFELLQYFLHHPGRVLTRRQIIDRVWGAGYIGDSKTLDVHIKRLRNRIETDPKNPERIVTVRGLGYKLENVAS